MPEETTPKAPEFKTKMPALNPVIIPSAVCSDCATPIRFEVRTFGNTPGNKKVCGLDGYCDTCHCHFDVSYQHLMATTDNKWKPAMSKDAKTFDPKKAKEKEAKA